MAERNTIIYIKADRNVELEKADVTIADVMEVECSDADVLARVKSLKLVKFHHTDDKKKDRITMSVVKVIGCDPSWIIGKIYPWKPRFKMF